MSDTDKKKISTTLVITGIAWAAAVVISALLWFVVIGPDMGKINTINRQKIDGTAEIDKVKSALAKENAVKEKIRLDSQELANVTNSHVLAPLLNSYAMQAKELLAFSAAGSGLELKETTERYRVPLPASEKPAMVYFDRMGIECVGEASLMELVRFTSSVEERFPYVTVTGLKIIPQKKTPERHRVEFLLEWPVIGEKPPAPPKGKK